MNFVLIDGNWPTMYTEDKKVDYPAMETSNRLVQSKWYGWFRYWRISWSLKEECRNHFTRGAILNKRFISSCLQGLRKQGDFLLYQLLHRNWKKQPEQAEKIREFFGMASLYVLQQYPVNAIYYMQLEGINNSLHSRSIKASNSRFTENRKWTITDNGELIKESIQIKDTNHHH